MTLHRKIAKPSPRSGVSLPLGAHPANTGGKVGRSGRPPEAFRDFLARMRQEPGVQDELERALKDRESKGFASALKVLVEYDTDKPVQRLKLSVEALSEMTDDELEAIAEGRAPARRRTLRE
jgi:hypothetical protein